MHMQACGAQRKRCGCVGLKRVHNKAELVQHCPGRGRKRVSKASKANGPHNMWAHMSALGLQTMFAQQQDRSTAVHVNGCQSTCCAASHSPCAWTAVIRIRPLFGVDWRYEADGVRESAAVLIPRHAGCCIALVMAGLLLFVVHVLAALGLLLLLLRLPRRLWRACCTISVTVKVP